MNRIAVVFPDRRITYKDTTSPVPLPDELYREDLWAIQWDGRKGHIEYRGNRANQPFDDVGVVQPYMDYADKYRADQLRQELLEKEALRNSPEYLANAISDLWGKAFHYEATRMRGSAVVMIESGALRQLPKCLAVMTWKEQLWALYYQKRDQLTAATGPDEIDAVSHDFTSMGELPHPIRECLEEYRSAAGGPA